MSRELDAKIAVKWYGWRWNENTVGGKLLLPPPDDKRTHWCGIWDENGIPHYLPRYSKGEID